MKIVNNFNTLFMKINEIIPDEDLDEEVDINEEDDEDDDLDEE